ncbi:endospore germination permease [Desulfitobacterium sp.]|uniref:GerAB/ArcD/ProY family transporter n=1 Tax=Desulfitobacterium sp. TaxID=49981 RepID=UPI002BA05E56|nr:endospore germination permease [Desulfitobacterium sp.]HVJ50015.1 endospore germination permease [Desulfitobacterium sp.]
MLEEGKISTRQFTLMLFCLLQSSFYYNMPQIKIAHLKQDVWLIILVSWAIDAGLAVIFYVLGQRYPNQTMVQYSVTILGSWLGKLVGLSFVLFFASGTTLYLLDISYFLVTTLMPETPIIVFSLVILLVSAYAVNSGLEVIARLSEIIAPIMIISLLVVFLLNLNQVELEKFLPMFQHRALDVFKESLRTISVFGICIVMGMFMAYHNIPKEALKAKLTAITMGSVLAIMILLQLVSVLGVNMSSLEIYPVFRLAKYIEAGDFFERIEPLMVVFWVAGTFIAVTILYYNSVLGLAQILKLPRYQSLTPYVGGVIMLTSMLGFRNVTELNLFIEKIFPYGALIVEDLLMFLLFAISYLRHGKRQNMLRKGGKT